MFTISIAGIIGLMVGSAFVGLAIGFFTMAILSMGGRCSDEEERRPWPGEVKQ